MRSNSLMFYFAAAILTSFTLAALATEVLPPSTNISAQARTELSDASSGKLCDLLKRQNKEKLSEKKVMFVYNSSVSDLVDCVQTEFVNYSLFNERRPELVTSLDFLLTFIEKYLALENWTMKLMFLKVFIDGMSQASDMKQRFHKCTYWGSDLVETLADINVRLLALRNLDGPLGNPDFHWKKTVLVHRYEVIKDRASRDVNMSAGMRSLYETAIERVDRALGFLSDFTGDIVISETLDICPEI